MSCHVAGVANAGNTCFLGAVLQEFAAFPDHYNSLFEPLAPEGAMRNLQTSLHLAVKKVRAGETVSAKHVQDLLDLLRVNGWQEKQATGIKGILHKAFPHLFPGIHQSPYQLQDSLSKFFGCKIYRNPQDSEGFFSPLSSAGESRFPIVLLSDTKSHGEDLSLADYFKDLGPLPHGSLIKIRLPSDKYYQLERRIGVFHLSLVHYSPRPQHIATSIPKDDAWLVIDDEKLALQKNPPQGKPCQVLYKKYSLQKSNLSLK